MAEQDYTISKALRGLETIEKGILSPVKGIKGGFVTRRFPEMTKAGKKQIAAKRQARLAASAPYTPSALPSTGSSRPFDLNAHYKRKAATARSESAAREKRILSNQSDRLPSDMQGAASRSYF